MIIPQERNGYIVPFVPQRIFLLTVFFSMMMTHSNLKVPSVKEEKNFKINFVSFYHHATFITWFIGQSAQKYAESKMLSRVSSYDRNISVILLHILPSFYTKIWIEMRIHS